MYDIRFRSIAQLTIHTRDSQRSSFSHSWPCESIGVRICSLQTEPQH